MTNEIREAAERLISWCFASDMREINTRDILLLANAYLAQHPSDGDEAVTALIQMHIAANALLYAIDNDLELAGVMANMRQKITDSQGIVMRNINTESEPQ